MGKKPFWFLENICLFQIPLGCLVNKMGFRGHERKYLVFQIPFSFVKELIIGLIQFNKVFYKIIKDFKQPLLEFI